MTGESDPSGGMFPAAGALYVDLYTTGDDSESGYGYGSDWFPSEEAALADAGGRLVFRYTAGPGLIGFPFSTEFPAFASFQAQTGGSGREFKCSLTKLVFRFYTFTASCYGRILWEETLNATWTGPDSGTVPGTPAPQEWLQPPADYDGSHIDGSFSIDDPTTWAASDDFTHQVTTIPASVDTYSFKTVTIDVPAFWLSFVEGYTPFEVLPGGIPEPDLSA